MICPSCGAQNTPGSASCRACGTSLRDDGVSSQALPPLTQLRQGDFVVEAVLGQGGFGITYLCTTAHLTTAHLGNRVAIKEMFPADCVRVGATVAPGGAWTAPALSGARLSFLQEGVTLSRLKHPGLVRVEECFEENDTAYMVMGYVAGRSLARVLEDSGGVLPERQAVAVIEQIGRALDVVHEAGLLHRDIKPDNIMIADSGRAVLIDFGAMRGFAPGRSAALTVMLTPGYAPLEQYAQRARFGPYTDIYALAATLYHLLSGTMPVASTDRAAGVPLPHLRQLRPQVSAAVADAVMEALVMEVDKRPPSARAFLSRLATGGTFIMPLAAPHARGCTTLHVLPTLYGVQSNVVFAPNGEALACGCADAMIRLWDTTTGQLAQTIVAGEKVGAVAFSPTGGVLAVGRWEAVVLWNLPEAKLPRLLRGHHLWVSALDFSPDGAVLATASGENTVKLWEVAMGQPLRTLTALHAATCVAYAPDGALLASGHSDKAIRIWNARTGALEQMLLGHHDKVTSVAFAPDGSTLVSAGDDNTVKFWEAGDGFKSGKLLGTLQRSGAVSPVVFSPDSRLLAFGSHDNTVKLWDARTGELLETLHGHANQVTSVAFAPYESIMASGSLDKTIRLWRLGVRGWT